MKQDLTAIKSMMETWTPQNPVLQEFSFVGFPITNEPDLESFTQKLSDQNYRESLAAALCFSVGT